MKRTKNKLTALLAAILTVCSMNAFAVSGDVLPEKIPGDANRDGAVNRYDAEMLQSWLLRSENAGFMGEDCADLNQDHKLDARDLTMLKHKVLFPETQTQPGGTDPAAYMQQVRDNYVSQVPQNILNAQGGNLTHITYFSQKANKMKGANVWTPPGYDPSKQYPVFYVNHGIQGNEFTMLGDFHILESAAGLIQNGEAVPMIIVFTFMYTNPNKDNCDGINAQEVPFYDDFLYDLTDSLMPYIESNYSCKTGRENTAIGGFSMGGRESLYIGIMRPDLFGYIAASSPAPGVVPARDNFMEHVGSIREDQFRMSEPYLPYLLMITGGTADGMVGDFPEQYHNLFTRNNTDHIWISVPGGGHDGGVGTPFFYNFIRNLFKA